MSKEPERDIEFTLEKLSRKAATKSEFGDAVLREIYKNAALAAKHTKKLDVIPVPVLFTVRRIPGLPEVPGPDEIDICWETSSSMSEYIDCTSPVPDLVGPVHIDTCDELWIQFRAATNIVEQIRLFFRLMSHGCIQWERVMTRIDQLREMRPA